MLARFASRLEEEGPSFLQLTICAGTRDAIVNLQTTLRALDCVYSEPYEQDRTLGRGHVAFDGPMPPTLARAIGESPPLPLVQTGPGWFVNAWTQGPISAEEHGVWLSTLDKALAKADCEIRGIGFADSPPSPMPPPRTSDGHSAAG